MRFSPSNGIQGRRSTGTITVSGIVLQLDAELRCLTEAKYTDKNAKHSAFALFNKGVAALAHWHSAGLAKKTWLRREAQEHGDFGK
jgi:hypothetical protein